MTTATDTETVIVTATEKGKYQVEAQMGGLRLLIDEPASVGGLGSGPNPYDLLSAALGACTTMTIRLYAERKGWPLTGARTSVRHSRAGLKAPDRFELDIALDGDFDEAQRARLMEIAERCPVHLTLTRGSQVRARLLPPQTAPAPGPADSQTHVACMEEACADCA